MAYFMAWTASVTWYIQHLLTCTKVLQNFWFTLVLYTLSAAKITAILPTKPSSEDNSGSEMVSGLKHHYRASLLYLRTASDFVGFSSHCRNANLSYNPLLNSLLSNNETLIQYCNILINRQDIMSLHWPWMRIEFPWNSKSVYKLSIMNC